MNRSISTTRSYDIMSQVLDEFHSNLESFFSDVRKNNYPRMDISETDNNLIIEASVPGLTKNEVSVDYKQGLLTISGVKQERKNSKYHTQELHRSSFTRCLNLSDDRFDTSKIECKLENGLLLISIPRRTQVSETKKIEIK